MNISESEAPATLIAKTCGCREQQSRKKVTYSFIDSYHNICIDKKDIISSELTACEKLLTYATDRTEKLVIEKEISELKIMLDLVH
jgi:hypothetical protein